MVLRLVRRETRNECNNGNTKDRYDRDWQHRAEPLVAGGRRTADEHCSGHTLCMEHFRCTAGERVWMEAGANLRRVWHRGGGFRTDIYRSRAAAGQVRAILDLPDRRRAG